MVCYDQVTPHCESQLCISSQLYIQWYQLGGLALATVAENVIKNVKWCKSCFDLFFFQRHSCFHLPSHCYKTFVLTLAKCLLQFSCSVMSNSLWPHELQQARPPCPSPTPGFHPNPCPSSQWWHPTILSSVVPFSSCPQSFPASGSFQMSQLFTSGGQSIRVSASTSVLPMNTHDWSPLGWTGWIRGIRPKNE